MQRLRKMNENKIAHLKFIQSIIDRMNSNSFIVKRWTLILVLATISLAEERRTLMEIVPIFLMWLLDSYYLFQERSYRDLYEHVSKKNGTEIDFSLKISIGRCYRKALFSKTIAPFYLILLIIPLYYA